MATATEAAVQLDYPTYIIQQNFFSVREWDYVADILKEVAPTERVERLHDLFKDECEELVNEESGPRSFCGWCAHKFLDSVNWMALAQYYIDDIEDLMADA